jgi:hypothetical protein
MAQTVINLIQDIEMERDNDLKFYTRLAQSSTFKDLRMTIANNALTMITTEWDKLHQNRPTGWLDLGPCECSLLLQYGLPCRHHLYPFYVSGYPLPRTLCHSRWWLNREPITMQNWGPYCDWTPGLRTLSSGPVLTSPEQRIQQLRNQMDNENKHRFDRQRERQQGLLNEKMANIGVRRLQLQRIPINQPDPVPKRTWTKTKPTGRVLTANELGERRQRTEQRRINEEERLQQLEQQVTTRSQDPFNSQLSTIIVASLPPPRTGKNTPDQDDSGSSGEPEPSTPPHAKSTLPIRTPTTTERPRRRQISLSSESPEPSEPEFPVGTEYEQPASTAPPKLGAGKRKRVHTKRYNEARAMGDIAESQEAHKAARG